MCNDSFLDPFVHVVETVEKLPDNGLDEGSRKEWGRLSLL